MTDPTQMSIAELTSAAKKAYGMSWSQMGQAFGRSDRWMRKLANGETSGETFRAGLTELYTTGQISNYVPRRRTRQGTLMKVRGKTGTEAVTPKDTRGKVAPKTKRNTYGHQTTFLPGGARDSVTTMPKSPRSKNRAKGWKSVHQEVRTVAKSQAHRDKRMKVRAVVESKDGTSRFYVNLGSKSGYHASDVLSDVRTDHGGDFEAWANDQMQKAGASKVGSSAPEAMGDYYIVSMQVTSFEASRTKPERIAQDAAGTRRRGRWG